MAAATFPAGFSNHPLKRDNFSLARLTRVERNNAGSVSGLVRASLVWGASAGFADSPVVQLR
jgi:hypothetical protein